MTAPEDGQPYPRECYACGQVDDHPRYTHAPVWFDPSTWVYYHYDCVPPALVKDASPASQPGFDATAKGKRGDDLRAVLVKHAQSITEAPADKEN